MSKEEMKKWISNASIEQLLSKWRKSPPGDPFFQGEVGDYFVRVMRARHEADNNAYVQASKNVGWGN